MQLGVPECDYSPGDRALRGTAEARLSVGRTTMPVRGDWWLDDAVEGAGAGATVQGCQDGHASCRRGHETDALSGQGAGALPQTRPGLRRCVDMYSPRCRLRDVHGPALPALDIRDPGA
ncbi:hypothetical protein GCM10018965_011810 [Nonomuraea roseola]